MSRNADFVRRQWRASVWFFRLFPFWMALIARLNIWADFNAGRQLDWKGNVLLPAGIIAFAGAVYGVSRLIFKFVLAWVGHEERRR